MNWTKLCFAVAAALIVVAPATAHADCGEPGQDPCIGAVPTVDEIVAVMEQLTGPNIPAANKGKIVTPGFTTEEAGKIDDPSWRANATCPRYI